MKKTKRLKRLYNQLKHILPIISIVLSIFSISLFIIALRVTESWRNALSRSLEVISEGRIYPFRKGHNWGVSLQEQPKVDVNFRVSASVVFIKGNSTSEAEQANATGNQTSPS